MSTYRGGGRHFHGFERGMRVGYQTGGECFVTLPLPSEQQQRLSPQNGQSQRPDAGLVCRIVIHIA